MFVLSSKFYTEIRKRLSEYVEYLIELQKKICSLERELDKITFEKKRLISRLLDKYGFGYLTSKWVRNSVGRKYSYVVWIYFDENGKRKCVYLSENSDLFLRERELKRELKKLKKLASDLSFRIKSVVYGLGLDLNSFLQSEMSEKK